MPFFGPFFWGKWNAMRCWNFGGLFQPYLVTRSNAAENSLVAPFCNLESASECEIESNALLSLFAQWVLFWNEPISNFRFSVKSSFHFYTILHTRTRTFAKLSKKISSWKLVWNRKMTARTNCVLVSLAEKRWCMLFGPQPTRYGSRTQ